MFWSCYCLDRQTSIILGRPFAIADQDIDAELPIGVDDESRRSLAPFAHICRLRMIESRIQQTIYRVDKVIDSANIKIEIEANLKELEAWKATIPIEGSQDTSSLHSRDSYVCHHPDLSLRNEVADFDPVDLLLSSCAVLATTPSSHRHCGRQIPAFGRAVLRRHLSNV
jgi:hypothetical protein